VIARRWAICAIFLLPSLAGCAGSGSEVTLATPSSGDAQSSTGSPGQGSASLPMDASAVDELCGIVEEIASFDVNDPANRPHLIDLLDRARNVDSGSLQPHIQLLYDIVADPSFESGTLQDLVSTDPAVSVAAIEIEKFLRDGCESAMFGPAE
jgi:hypothetical protein